MALTSLPSKKKPKLIPSARTEAAQLRELTHAASCGHMLLGRVRPGSPVLVCGSCPLFFILAPSGVFMAVRADDAAILAQDLVGAKAMAELAAKPRTGLVNGATGAEL